MGKDNISVFVLQNDLRSCALVANLQRNHALVGIAEGLCHTRCTGANKGAAGNNAGFIVVQGRGIALSKH